MRNRKRLSVILVSILLLSMFAPFSALAEEDLIPPPRHAPNMYVDWYNDGDLYYDIMTVDWYCSIDAENTYWAVHNWDGGYAGFQNDNGKHVLLLSLWDRDDGIKPTIEYVKDGDSGEFGNEGTGNQVYTNYNWHVGKWYTMRVQVWTENGKSYFGQWVRVQGGRWIKTAVISYPIADLKFTRDSMFQEDFCFNNYERECRLRNAFGRVYGTAEWDSWREYSVSNTYFPTYPPTWDDVCWNVDYDCDWGLADDASYVWVRSGGKSDFASNENETTLPYTYSVAQADTPVSPDWISVQERTGGFSSDREERETIPAPAPVAPPPVNVVNATAGENNAASANIPDNTISDTLAKALADAAAQGNTAGSVNVAIDVIVPQGTAELSAVLSQNALNSLISAGINSLTINSGGSLPSVTLSLKALKTLQEKSNGDATIRITATPKLSKYAKKLIGDRPVFGIAANYEKRGKTRGVTSLHGSGTIAIPYALRPGETPDSVFGVSIDAKGNASRVNGSRYDPESGCILIPVRTLAAAYGVGSK